jgi:two-component system cell cycle response regulator DivK
VAETIVFVVANDPRARREIARTLWETTGLHAVSMRGGQPAVDWARAVRPALVVLDSSQPGPEALSLARQLRRQPGTEDIPILLMSDDGPAGHDSARAAGCDGFISKPFAPDDLAALVRQCMALRRQAPTGSAA